MGYCSDCIIFIDCPWFCNKFDVETEEPNEPCFDKEKLKEDSKIGVKRVKRMRDLDQSVFVPKGFILVEEKENLLVFIKEDEK